MARLELEPRFSRYPFERSTTELPSHVSTGYISACLIRFVPESARNHVGTDETFPLLLAARERNHTEPSNVTGAEKEQCPTETRNLGLLLTV